MTIDYDALDEGDLSRCSDCGMVLNLEAGEGFITDDGEVTCADHYPDRDPEDLQ